MTAISASVDEQDRATTITLDLYQQEFWVLEQAARKTGIRTRAATIRHIINEWGRRNLVAEPQPQPAGNGQTALVDPPVPYRAPVLREEVGVTRED